MIHLSQGKSTARKVIWDHTRLPALLARTPRNGRYSVKVCPPIFVKSQIITCREIAGKLLPFSSSKYFPSFTVCTAGEKNITSRASCDANNAILQRKNQRPASDGGLQPASLGPAWDGGPRPEVQQEEEDGALLQPPPPQRHQWHGGSFMPRIEWFLWTDFFFSLETSGKGIFRQSVLDEKSMCRNTPKRVYPYILNLLGGFDNTINAGRSETQRALSSSLPPTRTSQRSASEPASQSRSQAW